MLLEKQNRSEDWVHYLEQKMSSLVITDIEYRKETYWFSNTYYFQESYLTVTFLDSTTISKLEFGTYDIGIFSNYVILFDNSRPNFTRIKQRLFEIDESINYILTFDDLYLRKLDNFLGVILKKGWIEEIISYNDSIFQINIEFNDEIYKVHLISDAEQDVPLPFDFLDRIINRFLMNFKVNPKNRNTTRRIIKPIKSRI
jgi:hypothetical protein